VGAFEKGKAIPLFKMHPIFIKKTISAAPVGCLAYKVSWKRENKSREGSLHLVKPSDVGFIGIRPALGPARRISVF